MLMTNGVCSRSRQIEYNNDNNNNNNDNEMQPEPSNNQYPIFFSRKEIMQCKN